MPNSSLFLALLTVMCGLLSSSSSAQDVGCGKVHANELYKATNWNIPSKAGQNDYDLVYHRLEWAVDPAVWYIAGKVTSYFKSTIDGLTEVQFDLMDHMTINAVQHNGNNVNFTANGDNTFTVSLPTTLNEGELDSLTVDYEGQPISTGLGSFQTTIHGPDDVPVLWTLSEPYGARDWWPCKQTLDDKIDSVDIIVHCPEAYRTGSLGLLILDEVNAGIRTMHWKHLYPVATYLIAIAVTNYDVDSFEILFPDEERLEVLNYYYPEDSVQWKNSFGVTNAPFQVFYKLIGPYPFMEEKYGHAQFSKGGGMEHQTMSFMTSASPGLVGHELAHQWFGDKVTCGTWADIWLNEGFATYYAALVDNEFNYPQFQYFLRTSSHSIKTSNFGSVRVTDLSWVPSIFDTRLVYQKGAYLLHMLRWTIGDEAFYQGIRNFINDPELAYFFATTADLQFHLEKTSGADLNEFFADWYVGQGFPTYSMNVQQKGGKVDVQLNQTTSSSSVDFFEMNVPIRFYGNGDSLDVRVAHEENGQHFDLIVPFEIDSAKIDPDLWILRSVDTVAIEKEEKVFELYPNPVESDLIVNTSETIEVIRIYDLSGKLLLEQPVNALIKVISLEGRLSAGRYLCALQTASGIKTKPFIYIE